MWSKASIAFLDHWFPPRSKCAFCGHRDARHRLWDAIIERLESNKELAKDYNLPLEAIRAVRKIRPYCRGGKMPETVR